MSSILNSISAGELEVQQAPQVKPVKEDSIIDLLQDVEIEFDTCSKLEENLDNVGNNFWQDVEIQLELPKEENTEPIINSGYLNTDEFLQQPGVELENNTTDDFNTGFGENNDLHYKTQCVRPPLKTPLYRENYFSEFVSEEEKAAARHSLGLYNKGDVVAMSLLTAEDSLPSDSDWANVTVKHLRKGDKFFSPAVSWNSIFDNKGVTLEARINLITEAVENISKPTNSKVISSLGDVKVFLQGFKNGDNLHQTLEDMNQEMLRFEKTGNIS